MANTPKPDHWPPYPHIPICFDASDGNGTTRSYESISPISPSLEIHRHGRTIHARAAASSQFTNISPVSPATQSTNLSPIWPIPEPPPEVINQAPKRRTIRFFPAARPRIQLADVPVPSQKKLEERDPHPHRKSKLGLETQDSSPFLDTMTTISVIREKDERSSNIAQRIEERIWRYNRSGNVVKRWLAEIISWWISAICMATIVGVLIYFQNRKLPRWPSGLTLNVFIAVLSKISGAALMLPVSEALGQLKWSWFQGDSKKMWDFEIFDNASRGPWGSFLLLIRTKGKALAALGALITLFALALDPFFQQLVDFPERWALNGNSSIPRVIQYEPHIGVMLKAEVAIATHDQVLQVMAEPYFYDNGTESMPFGNGTRADIPLSCPSSNCTWPTYETLGFCSQCVEVPQLLAYRCMIASLDWISAQEGGSTATFEKGYMCGWFLNATSDIPVLMSGFRADPAEASQGNGSATGPRAEALLSRILPLVSNPGRNRFYGGSINFKHVRNPVVDALIVGALNGSDSVYRGVKPVAHECIIAWCVKTIKSSYYLATYEEEVIQTFANTTDGPFPWTSSRFEGGRGEVNGTNDLYHSNISIEAPLNGHNVSSYGVSNTTAFSTIFTFDDAFPSFVTVANINAKPFMRYKLYSKAPMLRSLENINPWMLPTNVTNHMERLATALTNAIRSSGSKEMIDGQAFNKENFVRVRWAWLSLPLALLFLSLIFLLATIMKTSKKQDRLEIWKTSALATLLYGLPDHYQERITNRASGGTPRAKAKGLRVKILPKKGWRVSGNHFSPVTPNKNNQAPPGWI